MRFYTLIIFLFLAFNVAAQQTKRSLSHQDYDSWESISNKKFSKNGEWVAIEISLQDGDGRLQLSNTSGNKQKIIVSRASQTSFSEKSQWLLGLISPEKDSLRQLKLRKVDKEDFPKDSLLLVNLKSGEKTKVPEVSGVKVPKKVKTWYAYHTSVKIEKDTSSNEVKKSKAEDKSFNLTVNNFADEKSFMFEKVLDYGFSDDGQKMFLVKVGDTEIDKSKMVSILNLETGNENILVDQLTSFKSPVFSSDAEKFAFLGSATEEKEEEKGFQLYFLGAEGDLKSWENIPYQLDNKISEHFSPSFSDSGELLFFGWNPSPEKYAYEADTSILEEERVSLDIWGWQDKEIQPMQLKNLKDKEKESQVAVYQINSDKIQVYKDTKSSQIHFNRFKKGNWAIIRNDDHYRRAYSWDIQIAEDLSSINLYTGEVHLLANEVIGNPKLSPAGKFVYWYNAPDSSWQAIHLESKERISLTSGIKEAMYNELHDSPSLPGSYGSPGWTANDEHFLVYDRFDVWKVDPFDLNKAKNLTRENKENNKMTFRLMNLDPEKDYYDLSEDMVLKGFEITTKNSGFFLGDWKGNHNPKALVFGPAFYNGLKVAESKKRYIYQKSTFKSSPDVYYATTGFHKEERLSQINKQQEEINWGDVELVDYLTSEGDSMNGLLFKPENFDPEKKYPMMVYFYERRSDALHQYYSPVPSASIINIPYFVSNEYLVFVPDIKYKIGLPGPTAFDCIVPGVQAMVAKGFVDKDNIGIQGQSWGGYQVAYIVTQTNMFKAAGAGAPVVNMTSAYGGIRWGTGMSRMFQYEQTQSRIGGTLWEKPLYYIENSPLFFTDRVKTPVLIMHNDKDGAVPWYQGIEFFMALKRNNVPSWLLVYNGEDHNLKERKNKKDLSIRLSQFFDHYLKGEKAPVWMTEGLPAIEKGKTLKYELSAD